MPKVLLRWSSLILALVKSAADKESAVRKLAAIVVILIGAGVMASIGTFIQSLMWPAWISCAVAAIFSILGVTFGVAWQQAREPFVTVGPLTLDEECNVFYINVENGDCTAKILVSVDDFRDTRKLAHVEFTKQGHWRGRALDFDGTLLAHHKGQYGVIGVERNPPRLFIWTNDKKELILRGQSLGLSEQPPISFRLGVTCETPAGEQGTPQFFDYTIIPIPEAENDSRFPYKAFAGKMSMQT